jgi:hypothetical protein
MLKLIFTLGFPKQLETDVHSELSVQDTGRILGFTKGRTVTIRRSEGMGINLQDSSDRGPT